VASVKTFDLRPTSDPNLFRVVDRKGDWDHYAFVTEEKTTYLRSVTGILHRAWGKPNLMTWAKHQLPGIVEQKLHYGGEKGDAVHQFISNVLSGQNCDRTTMVMSEDRKTPRELKDDEWDCILGFANFWRMHNPLLVAHERSVVNLTHGYAGSMDWIGILRESCGLGPKKGCDCEKFIGKLILPDWKSSASIWPEMFAQIAAYAKADLTKIIGDRRIQGTAIVRVGTKHKNGFEAKFRTVPQMNTDWKRYKGAIAIDDADYKGFDPESIFDIPESVSLTVEREELEPKQIQEVA
jgi:hypothetical protein